MAFLLFRDLRVETVVLEVGLGGRLDATNVVTPKLCAITPIDYDHEQYLGRTIEAIAREKAGILKRGAPAVFARQRPEAERVLVDCARELSVTYDQVAQHSIEKVVVDAHHSRFDLDGAAVECPLAGEHQVDNAATAALVLRHLGAPLDGIASTEWPGRLERIVQRSGNRAGRRAQPRGRSRAGGLHRALLSESAHLDGLRLHAR